MNLLKDLSEQELVAAKEIIAGEAQRSELYIYNRLINKGIIKISGKRMIAGCPPIEETLYQVSEETRVNSKQWLSELE